MINVLLLNYTYEVISFISERKAIKLLFKGKAEVLSVWDNIKLYFSSGFMHLPSVLRMKYMVFRRYKPIVFSRTALLKRDQFVCQYCGRSEKKDGVVIEVDHIVPSSLGGQSSFTNCVAACKKCNRQKGQRTPDEAEMKLIREPVIPSGYLFYIPNDNDWHSDWSIYFRSNLT
jgi:hypothetical protein